MPVRGFEDNERNLQFLVDQLQTRIGVVPFVGAGLSIPQAGEHNTNQIVQLKTTIDKLEREISKLRQTLEGAQQDSERSGGRSGDDESLLDAPLLLQAT